VASGSDEWAAYRNHVPATEAEWQAFAAATPVGSLVGGVVVSVHRFGFFLDIGHGTAITGLVELPGIGPPGADSCPPVGLVVERAVVLGHRPQARQVQLTVRPQDLAAYDAGLPIPSS
jgi:hypothetical protein